MTIEEIDYDHLALEIEYANMILDEIKKDIENEIIFSPPGDINHLQEKIEEPFEDEYQLIEYDFPFKPPVTIFIEKNCVWLEVREFEIFPWKLIKLFDFNDIVNEELTKKVNSKDPNQIDMVLSQKDQINSTEIRDRHNNLIAKIDNTSSSEMIIEALKGGNKY